MSITHSCFISYRRNEGDKKFLINFKKIIESEAHRVTNVTKVFFDEESIEWGNEFDKKIYNSIVSSYFFLPVYHIGYLHVDNVWCARELYHALEVEKIIRNAIDNESYCYILPILFRGQTSALPNCICTKKVREIRQLEAVITSNRTTGRLTEFRNNLYDTFLVSFQLLSEKNINISELCANIKPPTDEEIKEWIKVQKAIEKKAESVNLPILKKNAE